MKNIEIAIFCILFTILGILVVANAADDVATLLSTGKAAIENGQYKKAVDCLGKILAASGNKSDDDRIVAFGATVQAYGVWKLNNPQMNPTVVQYLHEAIARDPSWEYPKKLLKEVTEKK